MKSNTITIHVVHGPPHTGPYRKKESPIHDRANPSRRASPLIVPFIVSLESFRDLINRIVYRTRRCAPVLPIHVLEFLGAKFRPVTFSPSNAPNVVAIGASSSQPRPLSDSPTFGLSCRDLSQRKITRSSSPM